MPDGMPDGASDQTSDEAPVGSSAERRNLAAEKKNQRYVWWYLAYFLFGIHIVAFVMIYAVTHAK